MDERTGEKEVLGMIIAFIIGEAIGVIGASIVFGHEERRKRK